jgi:hypothetical protein
MMILSAVELATVVLVLFGAVSYSHSGQNVNLYGLVMLPGLNAGYLNTAYVSNKRDIFGWKLAFDFITNK